MKQPSQVSSMTRRQNYIRELKRSTALITSAEWLVSENMREIRDRQKAEYYQPVDPSFLRHLEETVHTEKRKPLNER